MTKYKYVLFDLDGTISESALGVRKSLEHAIEEFGKPIPNLDDYSLYIGPPLLDTFLNLCHFTEQEAKEGVEVYRKFYDEHGKYMNKLYDGLKDVFVKLRDEGVKIAVCTSKFEAFAKEIIELLGVADCFDAICGSTLDGSRKDKKDLIPYAIEALGGDFETERKNIVMIGDTYFDARGAKMCEVDFIGVKYGYGVVEYMEKEGAKLFAEKAIDLIPMLID